MPSMLCWSVIWLTLATAESDSPPLLYSQTPPAIPNALGLPDQAPTQTPSNPVVETLVDPPPAVPAANYINTATPLQRYVDVGWIMWEASDPRNIGKLLNFSIAQAGGATQIVEVKTDTGNTDHQHGIRWMQGKWIDPLLAWEWGGYWTHNNEFGADLTTANGGSLVFSANNNERLDTANVFQRLENWGLETNLRSPLADVGGWQFDGLLGLRFIEHEEKFIFKYQPRNSDRFIETFKSVNHYIGPQLGLETRYRVHEYFQLRAATKGMLALRQWSERIKGPITPGNGRFTGASNIGSDENTDITSVFEFSIGGIFQLTPNIAIKIGYDALFFTEVLRAADQLDFANVGGRPIYPEFNDDLWISGVNFSVSVNY